MLDVKNSTHFFLNGENFNQYFNIFCYVSKSTSFISLLLALICAVGIFFFNCENPVQTALKF